MTFTPSLPEPAADVHAQLAAMLDPHSTKDSVFVVPANDKDIPQLPRHVLVIRRPQGTFITTNHHKAAAYYHGPITDALMARLLDYVQEKRAAIASDPVMVTAMDGVGHVISEAVVSRALAQQQAAIFQQHAPHARVVVGMLPERMRKPGQHGVRPGFPR